MKNKDPLRHWKDPENALKEFKQIIWIRKRLREFHKKLTESGKYKSVFALLGEDGWPEPDPIYQQLESGIRLEYSYGHPNKLYTRWGCVMIFRFFSAHIDDVAKMLMKHIKLKLYKPQWIGFFGEYGPIYDIIKVNGELTPNIIPKKTTSTMDTNSDYVSCDDAHESWRLLFKRMKKEDGI